MSTCDCAGGHALLCPVHAEEAERLMLELVKQREATATKPRDPSALVCQCGHQASDHVLGERACEGAVMRTDVRCPCSRFNLWFDAEPINDEPRTA